MMSFMEKIYLTIDDGNGLRRASGYMLAAAG